MPSRLAVVLLLLAPSAWCTEPRTENVILITLDGVRTEEIFGGLDAVIAEGAKDDENLQIDGEIDGVHARFWRDSPAARRAALMPFLWHTLAPAGVVLGNASLGSRVRVRNAIKWSSPGYLELMTGKAQPEVVDNTLKRYPFESFPEHLVDALDLPPTAVAQFGSWDGFKLAAASRDDAFFMNGATEAIPPSLSTPEMDLIVALRADVMELWEESSSDVLTLRLAEAYLKKHRPRFLWLGLGQSDNWSHADRYDRLLDYLHLADRLIGELWATLQSDLAYRGRTTLILTTDHGRGHGPHDWMEHDESIPGSGDIWIAIMGPDTPPRGELSDAPVVYQADVAATVLTLFGLDPADFSAEAGPPIAAAFGPAR